MMGCPFWGEFKKITNEGKTEKSDKTEDPNVQAVHLIELRIKIGDHRNIKIDATTVLNEWDPPSLHDLKDLPLFFSKTFQGLIVGPDIVGLPSKIIHGAGEDLFSRGMGASRLSSWCHKRMRRRACL